MNERAHRPHSSGLHFQCMGPVLGREVLGREDLRPCVPCRPSSPSLLCSRVLGAQRACASSRRGFSCFMWSSQHSWEESVFALPPFLPVLTNVFGTACWPLRLPDRRKVKGVHRVCGPLGETAGKGATRDSGAQAPRPVSPDCP